MRLLISSGSPLTGVGDTFYGFDSWVRIAQHLAEHVDVTLWAPVERRSAPPAGSWKVDVRSLGLEAHEPYESFLDYYRQWARHPWAWRLRARQLVSRHDIVVLRLPSPSVSLVASAARWSRTPLVLVVGGDMLASSNRILTSTRLKRVFCSALTRLFLGWERRSARSAALVYAYSPELVRRFEAPDRQVRCFRDPHLGESDFVVRTDTCGGQEVRLVRVCWLLPSKGLEFLLESVALLRARGRRVRLEIVGKARVESYEEGLRRRARELGIADAVTFSGWVPFDRIGEAYLRADIQVISSLAEGTPRCIDEGAARGLPLVSAAVGGCSDILEHERTALLVPPRDPLAMANAVERIITDGSLRRELIGHGYELARAGIFELLGQRLLAELRALVRGTCPGNGAAPPLASARGDDAVSV